MLQFTITSHHNFVTLLQFSVFLGFKFSKLWFLRTLQIKIGERYCLKRKREFGMSGLTVSASTKKPLLSWWTKEVFVAEAEGFEPPWVFTPKLFSRQPRYDRFDMPPYIKLLFADFNRY